MIKLIFSDMDGTLLTPEGNLPDGFDDMVKELRKRGCRFIPASGRQYYSLIKTFAAYQEDMIFMGDNGTVIRDGQGKDYYADAMPMDIVERVARKGFSIDQKCIVFCGSHGAYITRQWEPYYAECKLYFEKVEYIDDVSELSAFNDDIVKVAFADCQHRQAEELLYKPMAEEFGRDAQVVLSSDVWVDVMNNGAGKGNGVTMLRKALGIGFDECAAFGDYLNDYTMMQSVGYSFAMANAFPELKKAARYEAPSNAEFGVVKKVYELLEKGLI